LFVLSDVNFETDRKFAMDMHLSNTHRDTDNVTVSFLIYTLKQLL